MRRRPRSTSLDDSHDIAAPAAHGRNADEEQRVDCFDRCLGETAEESRSLVLRYYEGERHAKIANRRRLAAELGLSDNALRSRVQRVRNGLERCVEGCVTSRRQDAS